MLPSSLSGIDAKNTKVVSGEARVSSEARLQIQLNFGVKNSNVALKKNGIPTILVDSSLGVQHYSDVENFWQAEASRRSVLESGGVPQVIDSDPTSPIEIL